VIKHFEELMESINFLTSGNFPTVINVPKSSECREIAEAFNNMTKKIQELINEKQKLVAYISHELKTPLTKIQLAQELLMKEGKGNQKYIRRTLEETDCLNKLIDELLETSELELACNKFIFEKLDFKEIVKENIEKNSLLFENRSLKINLNLSEKPVFLKTNRKLMEHALNNIFSNIVKYAPANSEVDLTLKAENNKVLFSVRDYGPGVEPENYEKIFEPFYRTGEYKSRKTDSTGLGLSLVKKITEMHGGKVRASSPEDNKSGLVMTLEI
jgi:signal transduction histidine kinase